MVWMMAPGELQILSSVGTPWRYSVEGAGLLYAEVWSGGDP